jgi:Short-chain dehydrogenases of various substrate specificities
MLKPQYGHALVTGASSGLGREFARQLSRSGWALVLVGRKAAALEQTASLLEGPAAAKTLILKADLSERGAAARLHDECKSRGIAVEMLVNNAGSGLFGPCVDLAPDAVESMIALNVASLSSLCSLFGADMAARGSGRILNVGSLVGKFAMPYFAAYSASKGYVISYSLALRAELKASGVRVSCVMPGYIRTDFDERAGIESPKYRSFSKAAGMSAEAVARSALRIAARNRPYAAAGWTNKLASALSTFVPRSALPTLSRPALDLMTEGR